MKDVFKGTYMDSVIDILTSIHYFYQNSAKRVREITELSEVLNKYFSKPGKANGTRWVDHKQTALIKVKRSWKMMILYLEQYASDNANRAEDRAKATGIRRKLLEHKFVHYMPLLLDIFNEVSKVSLLFQRDDVTVPTAMAKLESVMLMLTSMEDLEVNGFYLTEFIDEMAGGMVYKEQTLQHMVTYAALHDQKCAIIQKVLTCLDN